MRLGRGLQRLCLRLWWGSLGYSIPFSRRGRARGGGCAGRGADAAALCPADKEELHNRRLRDTRVCARDGGRWVGPRGRAEGGAPGKAQSFASWGSQGLRGHGAQDKGQLQGSRSAESPSPTELRPLSSLLFFLLQEGGRSPDWGAGGGTDSLPLRSSQRALQSLISGLVLLCGPEPFRIPGKVLVRSPHLPSPPVPVGPQPPPTALDESALHQDKASAPFPSRGAAHGRADLLWKTRFSDSKN